MNLRFLSIIGCVSLGLLLGGCSTAVKVADPAWAGTVQLVTDPETGIAFRM
jgi:predicted component of type VI protein secretion system